MEQSVSGTIEFEGVTYSRAIQRFVEKRIHKWFANHETAGNAKYFVTFRKQGPGHTINCNVEIKMAEETWVSFRYGAGPHQALVQCLEHLSRTRGMSTVYTFTPEPLNARRHRVVMVPAFSS